jgi:hypothetical protein
LATLEKARSSFATLSDLQTQKGKSQKFTSLIVCKPKGSLFQRRHTLSLPMWLL